MNRSKSALLRNFINSKTFTVLFWIFLVIAGAIVLYFRYPYALNASNFYAEDGKVFALSVYQNGFAHSFFTLFNGYFVFLQYVVLDLSFLVNNIFGHGIVTLPKSIAIVSCITIAFGCSLPWLLFRKKIGSIMAILAVILLLFTPLGRSDYTVIGTIGNLKFLFFYIATMLIIYRNDISLVPKKSLKLYFVDIALLLCVFTNVLVVLLLPLALFRYKQEISKLLKTKKIKLSSHKDLLGIALILIISGIYVVAIYINGIPKMEGYLDGPLVIEGFINAFFRVTWYGILYPAYTTFNIVMVIGLLLLIPLAIFMKKNKLFVIAVAWAICVYTIGFVANRPGVTEFLRDYTSDGGPGQFFYGGTMIFVFGLVYLVSQNYNSLKLYKKAIALYLVLIYMIWAFPYAGSGENSYDLYRVVPTSYQAVTESCNKNSGKYVTFDIYPSAIWTMTIERDLACQKP